jgi:putative membrane protein
MTQRLSAFLVACSVLAMTATQAVAQQTQQQAPPWYGPGPWWSDGYGWQFWWICPFMMLFMLGVMAVIMLARRHAGEGRWATPGSPHSSLQVLSERFARGEIQRDEYEEKKAAILSRP